MLLYIKILSYCIKTYNIKTINELKQFLLLKSTTYDTTIKKGKVICYVENNKLLVNFIKGISEDKLILNNKIIEKPQIYLCINNRSVHKIIDIVLFYTISIMALTMIFINIKVSFLLLILLVKVNSNKIMFYNFLFIILIINLVIYKNYFVIVSLFLLIASFKNKNLLYLSCVYGLFETTIIHYYLFMLYIIYIYLLNFVLEKEVYNKENNMLKLLVKKPIETISTIRIDGMELEGYGVYFFEVTDESEIYINDINIKFIELSSISNSFKIIYVTNHNSFFTNKQKYSKIDSVGKYYIYLYNRR